MGGAVDTVDAAVDRAIDGSVDAEVDSSIDSAVDGSIDDADDAASDGYIDGAIDSASDNAIDNAINIDNTILDAAIATALTAADCARVIALRHFRAAVDVHYKADDSPVTIADRAIEEAVRELLRARHPQHGIYGEEGGGDALDGEWCWVIDPIDGTKSFIAGKPTFGTLIALLHFGAPQLGVIDCAALNERWLGASGRATTHNGARCNTRADAQLADAKLFATTPDMFDVEARARFDALSRACRFRGFGGDCYAYGLLASGFVEVVCEAQLQPHDFMAAVAVVEGAGGVISDWRGNALSAQSSEVLACANRALHESALAKLAL